MSFFSIDHIQKLKLSLSGATADSARDHGALDSLHPPRRPAPKAKETGRASDFSEAKPEPTGWH